MVEISLSGSGGGRGRGDCPRLPDTGYGSRVPGLVAVLRCDIATSSLRRERGSIHRELFGSRLGSFQIPGRLH
jgi:hypothetical protein